VASSAAPRPGWAIPIVARTIDNCRREASVDRALALLADRCRAATLRGVASPANARWR
jgi:hypothetical protein